MADNVYRVGIGAEDKEFSAVMKRMEKNVSGAVQKIEQQVQKASDSFDRMESGIKRIVGATAVLYASKRSFQAVTEAAGREEMSLLKLESQIRATGAASGLMRQELVDLADEMQRETMFDSDSVRQAEAVLLTFRRVYGSTFREGIRLAADMSQVLGQDLQSSIIQVGKALNDPTVGLTALRRVGVSFSEQQVQMIYGLERSGRLMEAQAIILQELRTQFGGASTGVMDSYNGRLDTMGDAFDNLKKATGEYVIHARTVTGIIEASTAAMERQTAALKDHRGPLYNTVTVLDSMGKALMFSARGWGMMYDEVEKVSRNPFFRAMMGASGLPMDFLFPQGKAGGGEKPFSFGGGGAGGKGVTRGFGVEDIVAAEEEASNKRNRISTRWEESEFKRLAEQEARWNADQKRNEEAALKERMEIEKRYNDWSVMVTEQKMLAEYEYLDERVEAEKRAMEDMKRYQVEMSGWWGDTVYGMYLDADGRFGDIGKSFHRMLQQMAVRAAIYGVVNLVTGGTFGAGIKMGLGLPGRANGGPVIGGQPYMVGERGPEMFVPNTSGKIVNNSAVNNVSMSFSFSAADRREMEGMSDAQLAKRLVRVVRDNPRLVREMLGK